jgi:hypothetical protein
MKHSAIMCMFLVFLCIAISLSGCTSSKAPAASEQSTVTVAPIAVATTPSCPDKLVWNGTWDSAELGMAGNHDLGTAWTKYTDRVYGDRTTVTMTQTCWDVAGKLSLPGVKCDITFMGGIDKNILSGTWSGTPTCSKSMDGRKFSLTMAADNKSWLGDLYDSTQDPSKFPPNWAGRKPVN